MLLPYFISTFNSQFHQKKKNLQLPKYHNPNDADTEKPNRRRYRETQPVSMSPHQTIANKPSQNHRRYHQTVVDITIPLLISPFHRRFPHSVADFIVPLPTQPFRCRSSAHFFLVLVHFALLTLWIFFFFFFFF